MRDSNRLGYFQLLTTIAIALGLAIVFHVTHAWAAVTATGCPLEAISFRGSMTELANGLPPAMRGPVRALMDLPMDGTVTNSAAVARAIGHFDGNLASLNEMIRYAQPVLDAHPELRQVAANVRSALATLEAAKAALRRAETAGRGEEEARREVAAAREALAPHYRTLLRAGLEKMVSDAHPTSRPIYGRAREAQARLREAEEALRRDPNNARLIEAERVARQEFAAIERELTENQQGPIGLGRLLLHTLNMVEAPGVETVMRLDGHTYQQLNDHGNIWGFNDEMPLTVAIHEYNEAGEAAHNDTYNMVARSFSHAVPESHSRGDGRPTRITDLTDGQAGSLGMSFQTIPERYSSEISGTLATPDANRGNHHGRARLVRQPNDWIVTVSGQNADLHGERPGDPIMYADGREVYSSNVSPGGKLEVRALRKFRFPFSEELFQRLQDAAVRNGMAEGIPLYVSASVERVLAQRRHSGQLHRPKSKTDSGRTSATRIRHEGDMPRNIPGGRAIRIVEGPGGGLVLEFYQPGMGQQNIQRVVRDISRTPLPRAENAGAQEARDNLGRRFMDLQRDVAKAFRTRENLGHGYNPYSRFQQWADSSDNVVYDPSSGTYAGQFRNGFTRGQERERVAYDGELGRIERDAQRAWQQMRDTPGITTEQLQIATRQRDQLISEIRAIRSDAATYTP